MAGTSGQGKNGRSQGASGQITRCLEVHGKDFRLYVKSIGKQLDFMLSLLEARAGLDLFLKRLLWPLCGERNGRGGKMEGHADPRRGCGHCLCELPVAWTRVRVQDGNGEEQPDAGFFSGIQCTVQPKEMGFLGHLMETVGKIFSRPWGILGTP